MQHMSEHEREMFSSTLKPKTGHNKVTFTSQRGPKQQESGLVKSVRMLELGERSILIADNGVTGELWGTAELIKMLLILWEKLRVSCSGLCCSLI